MDQKHLHIVSFDVPHPPDYGGVVDVFYRIKSLYKLGVRIHLHCFEYGRGKAEALEGYCESITYYERKNTLPLTRPYIVASRENNSLLQNLVALPYPILFEGIHCCAFLDEPALHGRLKMVRLHNIESDYYGHLAENENDFFKRIYFKNEAWQLERFEKTLHHADYLFAISPADLHYWKTLYGEKVLYLPAFHAHKKVVSPLGRGEYALYHGNLSVNENYHAAMFLVKEVFADLPIRLIIAGKNPHIDWFDALKEYNHIELCVNPSEMELFQMMQEAHLHVLPTFQPTGIKLKLLHALYTGRFCLTNSLMVQNTGIEHLCHIANSATDFAAKVQHLFEKEFTAEDLAYRATFLHQHFDNLQHAQTIVDLL